MRTGQKHSRAVVLLAAIPIVMSGFAAGFIACLQNERALRDQTRAGSIEVTGDAPPAVRAGVLASLERFQTGYARRDTRSVEDFVHGTFDTDSDILVLGINQFEWARGYPEVANLVYGDWQGWGDVHLNTDSSVINSSQDVAWLVTAGDVQFGASKRPIRFSAILNRKGDNWLFRQVQFQWEDRDLSRTDLLDARTYLEFFQHALRKIAPTPAAAGALAH